MAKTEPIPPPQNALPIRTTAEDVTKVCDFLAKKPTGATTKEARAIINAQHLDARKISAMKRWSLLEESGEKLRLSERGRRVAKDGGAHRAAALLEIVREIEPYRAAVERAAHTREYTITANDAAAHWHDHFKGQVSGSNEVLNEQVVCFFQIAQAADLGHIIIGRRGQPTRFEFDQGAVERFIDGVSGAPSTDARSSADGDHAGSSRKPLDGDPDPIQRPVAPPSAVTRVFITHGKNVKILGQVKRVLELGGKFEAVVAQERETVAKPVPEKVMDEMRACHAAVIHVGAEGTWKDGDGKEHPHINPNVLIEIGAAMALYGKRFILLVEDGVKLPSNLQGLYECRHKGEELSLDSAMKLFEALNTL